MNTEKAESKTCKDKQPCSCLGPCEHPDKKESWVNIYKDARGRFLGDEEYSSESEAFKNRDIFLARFSERERRRKKARALSINSPGTLKSDHIGPNYHRVKVGWENDIHWASYWMKVVQPVNTWNLKTNA